MLLNIPQVLTKAQVRECLRRLEDAEWIDGRVTAGHQSAKVKNNSQLLEGHPLAEELGELILKALETSPLFLAAALPLRVFPPLFNIYQGGQGFGTHVDNAIRQAAHSPIRLRTDLSATLFLSEPDSYDGGELVLDGPCGVHSIKLHAGDLVLYSASSLHQVKPVTRGARLASFFWIQSMIRDDSLRTIIFDLDMAIQKISRDHPDHLSVVELTGVYHNLLRRHAEV